MDRAREIYIQNLDEQKHNTKHQKNNNTLGLHWDGGKTSLWVGSHLINIKSPHDLFDLTRAEQRRIRLGHADIECLVVSELKSIYCI